MKLVLSMASISSYQPFSIIIFSSSCNSTLLLPSSAISLSCPSEQRHQDGEQRQSGPQSFLGSLNILNGSVQSRQRHYKPKAHREKYIIVVMSLLFTITLAWPKLTLMPLLEAMTPRRMICVMYIIGRQNEAPRMNYGFILTSMFEQKTRAICTTSKTTSTTSAATWLSMVNRIIHEKEVERSQKMTACTKKKDQEVVGMMQMVPMLTSSSSAVGTIAHTIYISK